MPPCLPKPQTTCRSKQAGRRHWICSLTVNPCLVGLISCWSFLGPVSVLGSEPVKREITLDAPELDLHFQHLRWNRAAEAWDAQIVLSNRGPQILRGPVYLETLEPGSTLWPANRDARGCSLPNSGWVDLTETLPAQGLSSGHTSHPFSVRLISRLHSLQTAPRWINRIWTRPATYANAPPGSTSDSPLPLSLLLNPPPPHSPSSLAPEALVESENSSFDNQDLGSLVVPITGPRTNVLETGAGLPLMTVELPLQIPATLPASSLAFLFGFASEETNAPNLFYDSFSITLSTADQSASALLLTADITGIMWAPPYPGGITVNEGRIRRVPISFADLAPGYPLRRAFSVSYGINPAFLGKDVILYLDLFDNQNALRSLAYLVGPSLRPGFIAVESSSQPHGPYARESTAVFNLVRQTATLKRMPPARFFRLRGDHPFQFQQIALAPDRFLFHYTCAEATCSLLDFSAPVLESSAQAGGPFAMEPDTVIDQATGTLSIPRQPRARYYRLVSEIPLTIKRTRLINGQILLDYEEP